ncbi:MAG: hypothetical protein GYA36_16105 [Veillonellaceae bacterium]|nr:hypothetical protein [Veillonellaceae bacterium]
MNKEFLYDKLTYKIIGILMKVHTSLGPEFPEKMYKKAVIVELEKEK